MLLGGKSRQESQLIGPRMPIAARDYLREKPAQGMLFCPAQWSDWLQVQLGVPVFVNGNANLVPDSVVDDYTQIYQGAGNWQSIAEKYRFNEILVSKDDQRQLVRRIRQTPGSWKIAYEDSLAILLTNIE